MTDPDVKAELSELNVLALTIWAEARGDATEGGSSVEERIAVGCVIRNRVIAQGSDYRSVCFAPMQFSCWSVRGGAANYAAVMQMARRLVGEAQTLAPDPLFQECRFLAEGIISRRLLDRVKGSRQYLTAALFRTAPPAWAQGRTPVGQVGSQVFFADVP